MRSMEELTGLITQWGVDRSIVQNSSAFAQSRKTHEEVCELVESVAKYEAMKGTVQHVEYMKEVKDAIGDIYVTLVMVCACNGTPIRTDVVLGCVCVMSDGPLKHVCDMVPDLIRCCIEDRTAVRLAACKMITSLRMLCDEYKVYFTDCVDQAYSVIKNRKGTLRPDGVFMKES